MTVAHAAEILWYWALPPAQRARVRQQRDPANDIRRLLAELEWQRSRYGGEAA